MDVDTFKNEVVGIGDSISATAENITTSIQETIESLYDAILETISETLSVISDTIDNISLDGIKDAMASMGVPEAAILPSINEKEKIDEVELDSKKTITYDFL